MRRCRTMWVPRHGGNVTLLCLPLGHTSYQGLATIIRTAHRRFRIVRANRCLFTGRGASSALAGNFTIAAASTVIWSTKAMRASQFWANGRADPRYTPVEEWTHPGIVDIPLQCRGSVLRLASTIPQRARIIVVTAVPDPESTESLEYGGDAIGGITASGWRRRRPRGRCGRGWYTSFTASCYSHPTAHSLALPEEVTARRPRPTLSANGGCEHGSLARE